MPSQARVPLGEWSGQAPTPRTKHTQPASKSPPVAGLPASLIAKYPFLNPLRASTSATRDLNAAATRAITLESRTAGGADSLTGDLTHITLSDTETSEAGETSEDEREVSYLTRYDTSSLPGAAGRLRAALRGPSRRPPHNSPSSPSTLPQYPEASLDLDLPYPDDEAVRWVRDLQMRITEISPPNLANPFWRDTTDEAIPMLSFTDMNCDSPSTPKGRDSLYPLSSTPLKYADSPSSLWSQPSFSASHLRSSFIPPSPSPDSSINEASATFPDRPSKLVLRHAPPPDSRAAMDALWEYESTLSSCPSSLSSARSSPFHFPLPQLHFSLGAEDSLFHSFKYQHDLPDESADADDALDQIAQDCNSVRLPTKFQGGASSNERECIELVLAGGQGLMVDINSPFASFLP